MQLTCVAPALNTEPGAGLHTTDTGLVPPVATGRSYVTGALASFIVLDMGVAGQLTNTPEAAGSRDGATGVRQPEVNDEARSNPRSPQAGRG
jgi:hypothetical protein